MAENDPPIFDVPIFNPAYFLDEDEITKAYLKANFLEFPIGQGLETLPDLRINNTEIHLGTNASTGDESVAIGDDAEAEGDRSVAIGNAATANGNESIAIGDGASTSTFTNAVAIGNGATASANNEVKLSDKASFIGNSTNAWAFGDVVNIANWAGIQHIALAKDGLKYALLQNSSNGQTLLNGVGQIRLNVAGASKAFITDTLHILGTGIRYNGTTQPFPSANNSIGFRWNGTSVGVGVDNVVGAFFATPSDRRVKKNIVEYEDGLTNIMKLKVKQYNFLKFDVANCDFTEDNCIIRDFSGNTIKYDCDGNCCDDTDIYPEIKTGMILDEVREIFPSLVCGGDENSIGTIDYSGLVPHLVKAIQQQQEQIEALKLEIEALKNP